MPTHEKLITKYAIDQTLVDKHFMFRIHRTTSTQDSRMWPVLIEAFNAKEFIIDLKYTGWAFGATTGVDMFEMYYCTKEFVSSKGA